MVITAPTLIGKATVIYHDEIVMVSCYGIYNVLVSLVRIGIGILLVCVWASACSPEGGCRAVGPTQSINRWKLLPRGER